MTEGEGDPVERWIEELRNDMELGDKSEHDFERLRSEAMLGRVLQRIQQEQSRSSWIQRVRRALRAIASFGSAIWNSRVARTLMP